MAEERPERSAYDGWPPLLIVGECRCPREDPGEQPLPPDVVEVSRRPGPTLTARCQGCGGFYQLQITEVVAARAGEQGEMS
ncbi:MAG TPA: hypothetical protein VKE74_19480 [Gemmataceae bacterium]|nr:hypothetical protein [Gemmataceae bacterium]